MGPSTRFSIVEEVCSKFRFLGKFVAKAITDSRMLDLPFSEAFYKWLLGDEGMFTGQDLQFVDPIMARSFAQLAAVAVKKHALESDPLLVRSLLSLSPHFVTPFPHPFSACISPLPSPFSPFPLLSFLSPTPLPYMHPSPPLGLPSPSLPGLSYILN